MLNDTDALKVLDHLRQKVIAAGFQDFDSHAFSLVADELGREERKPPTVEALLDYVRLLGDLLQKIGITHQTQVKEKLTQLLERGNGVNILLDTSSAHSIFDPDETRLIPLDGSTIADELSYGLNQLYSEIEKFQYPDPNPTSRGGPSP